MFSTSFTESLKSSTDGSPPPKRRKPNPVEIVSTEDDDLYLKLTLVVKCLDLPPEGV